VGSVVLIAVAVLDLDGEANVFEWTTVAPEKRWTIKFGLGSFGDNNYYSHGWPLGGCCARLIHDSDGKTEWYASRWPCDDTPIDGFVWGRLVFDLVVAIFLVASTVWTDERFCLARVLATQLTIAGLMAFTGFVASILALARASGVSGDDALAQVSATVALAAIGLSWLGMMDVLFRGLTQFRRRA
jgi:hypothetical protein